MITFWQKRTTEFPSSYSKSFCNPFRLYQLSFQIRFSFFLFFVCPAITGDHLRQPEIDDPQHLLQLIMDDKIEVVANDTADGVVALSDTWNADVNSNPFRLYQLSFQIRFSFFLFFVCFLLSEKQFFSTSSLVSKRCV
jgi:hypothetical protein